jgi:hypothetical protein
MCCYYMNADISIIDRVQKEVWHVKGGVQQVPQVEAEQIEVWSRAFLASA